ncbi:MAG: trypsin-like peptidase domain-containing protein, partial [Gammaproteobacteria bacterium]|nr:trypsin-like peptidase domain-containing protein [Gammaproteobacteria bacterium]
IAAPANADWVSYRCDELHESQPLESCEAVPGELDFSLVSVLGEPAATFGYVQPDATPISNGEALYILQHPDGRPQEITHGTDVEVDGSVLRYWNTLDTETGSSGSGIFRDADDALVGLHHCGGCAAPDQRNRGMLMTDLMPLIESYLCTETLSLTAATPGPLLEVAGNNNGVIEAGEQWSFLPRVLNSSCGDTINNASAVIGIAAESEADISLVETSADFGSIAPGQVADAAGPVHFDVAGGAGCGDSIIIDMGPLTGDAGQFSGANQVMATVGVENFETVLFEDFANGIPADWTVANFGTGSGPAQTWTSDNPGNRLPGLVAPFVIVDSDQNEGFMDEELITPVVDVSAYPSVRLRFSHDFNWYEVGGDEQADVEVRSSATFGAWLTIENFSGDDSSGTVELDITEWAADDLQLRFRYYNAFFDWWWAVDDVAILGSLGFACLIPGDTDGDSVPDELDNCTLAANPQQTDSDQDGIGNACDADINQQNDCLVNFADLSVLTSAFFSVPTAEQWNPDADFNGDNIVNFSDLSVLSEQFFLSPGPSSLPNNCQRAGH